MKTNQKKNPSEGRCRASTLGKAHMAGVAVRSRTAKETPCAPGTWAIALRHLGWVCAVWFSRQADGNIAALPSGHLGGGRQSTAAVPCGQLEGGRQRAWARQPHSARQRAATRQRVEAHGNALGLGSYGQRTEEPLPSEFRSTDGKEAVAVRFAAVQSLPCGAGRQSGCRAEKTLCRPNVVHGE